ncbi:MAG: molybdopterin-dependent oxidoreductase [Acidiferrobacterales bacterium]
MQESVRVPAAAFVALHGGRLLIPDTFAATTVPAGFKPLARGTLLGMAPFVGEGTYPLERLVGSGLGGRLVLDVSALRPETLVTPNNKFFIRTRYPDRLRYRGPWKISVQGLVEQPAELSLNELMQDEVPMGTHLLECAGNTANGGFGLISTARWAGIPVTQVLEKVKVLPQATRVIIAGFDEHSQPDAGSVAGASWSLTFAQLEEAGAFLATDMNGFPLLKDHGYPVRLIMPGWYACTCAKWVKWIVLADDTAPATGHMKEFASRTHQDGVPKLAKDFKPATMDLAAMPIRVEGWRVDGKILYRVVGILWGGDKPTTALTIRFNPDMDYVPVEDCDHKTNKTWTIWSHTWRPTQPGRYKIQLKVDDPTIRTRRLDTGYYVRTVEIKAI